MMRTYKYTVPQSYNRILLTNGNELGLGILILINLKIVF